MSSKLVAETMCSFLAPRAEVSLENVRRSCPIVCSSGLLGTERTRIRERSEQNIW